MFPSESTVKVGPMSDFKNIPVTFSILKLQKYDAYQNGEEFHHKPNGNDVKWPTSLILLSPPLTQLSVMELTIVSLYIFKINFLIKQWYMLKENKCVLLRSYCISSGK